jgi:FAD synthase
MKPNVKLKSVTVNSGVYFLRKPVESNMRRCIANVGANPTSTPNTFRIEIVNEDIEENERWRS